MVPERLQASVAGAFESLKTCIEAESKFFELARTFMTGALAIHEAVNEVNRTGESASITEAETAQLHQMVRCVQEYSSHLMALAKTRSERPFDVPPSVN